MTALAAPPPVKERKRHRRERPDNTKPRVQPPYAVIVDNDDKHTFEFVIEGFQKVFGYSAEKCFKLAEEIHKRGRSIVWSGSKEVAELKYDQLRGLGKDHYATRQSISRWV